MNIILFTDTRGYRFEVTLKHELGGIVAPAGWPRRVREGERGWPTGLWKKSLISIHLVPVRQGTANGWLFRIGKTDQLECRCRGGVMTGTDVVEECPELEQWRPRRAEEEWREVLGGRARRREDEGDEENRDFLLPH